MRLRTIGSQPRRISHCPASTVAFTRTTAAHRPSTVRSCSKLARRVFNLCIWVAWSESLFAAFWLGVAESSSLQSLNDDARKGAIAGNSLTAVLVRRLVTARSVVVAIVSRGQRSASATVKCQWTIPDQMRAGSSSKRIARGITWTNLAVYSHKNYMKEKNKLYEN